MFVKLAKKLFVSSFFLLLFTSNIFAQSEEIYNDEILEGQIDSIVSEENVEAGDGNKYIQQKLLVKVYKGSLSGSFIEVINDTVSIVNHQNYKVGDKVVITYSRDYEGNDHFYITDRVRREGLMKLVVLFVILAIGVGRIWGLTSLIGMGFSFFVLFKFVLPQILLGRDAVWVSVIGSMFIIPVTFCLSHGLKVKTLIAGLGTVVSLIITGIIAKEFVDLTHLSGFSSEEAGFLQFQLKGLINMRGLLLAGIIIASLGILDDITISQVSIVKELKDANHKYGFRELFGKGMNVGRDHIASLINTLVLVYTGSSLPLLLMFINNPSPFVDIINIELIADEIVRTLVGSIGLILAVPITTFLAAYYYNKES